MAKLDIQIQIKKTIKPSTPTPDHLQCLKLSFFDQGLVGVYASLFFCYLPSPNSSRAENTEKRCDKVERSLAETLTKFYPLAGRFNKDDLSVHCNDEGVEYVETNVNSNLADLLLDEDGPKIELLWDHLLPWSCAPPRNDEPTSPLLGVQVNQFNCGGLVIAIQISHMLADGFTTATFMHDWALSSRTGTTCPQQSYSQLLSSLFPPLPRPENQLPTDDGGAKIVTRRFVFDASAIAKLKDRIIDSTKPPSRVVIVMSLIWKVLVGISSAKHGHSSRDSCALIAVNLRKRTNISSLQHALGNFFTPAVASLESRKEFNDFVSLVKSASRDQIVNFGKESLAHLFDMYKVLGKAELDILVISSACGLPFYEANFGWGRPFWVSLGAGKSEVVCLLDTNDGNGIEAWISLKENDMAEFEKDPDILTFCPCGTTRKLSCCGDQCHRYSLRSRH